MTEETVQVQFVVTAIAPMSVGKIVALAAVELSVDDIPICTIQGIQVVRPTPHTLVVEAPRFKGLNGVSIPAAILPEELSKAIAHEVLNAFATQKSLQARDRATGLVLQT